MRFDRAGVSKKRAFHPGAVPLRAVGVVLVLLMILWFAHRQHSPPPQPRTLSVYCFSALEDVMSREILPAFQERWRARTGEKLEFITVFAGSGIVVDRILQEFTPQVAVLSSEIDAFRLSRAGVVPGTIWRGLPHHGVVTRSPLVLISRPGNPLGILRFADLAREGVHLVHPDPATSGCGIWSLVAVHTDAAGENVDQERALDVMRSVWANVVEEPPSARAALRAFAEGHGNLLITYEQQGLETPVSRSPGGEMIYPARTVMTEHVVLKVPRNIGPGDRELVDAFIAFLWNDESQTRFVAHGFRSVDEAKNRDRVSVPGAASLEDLGGALEVGNTVVKEIWRERILPGLTARAKGR